MEQNNYTELLGYSFQNYNKDGPPDPLDPRFGFFQDFLWEICLFNRNIEKIQKTCLNDWVRCSCCSLSASLVSSSFTRKLHPHLLWNQIGALAMGHGAMALRDRAKIRQNKFKRFLIVFSGHVIVNLWKRNGQKLCSFIQPHFSH